MKACYRVKALCKQEARKLNLTIIHLHKLGQLLWEENIASESKNLFITHYKYQIITIDAKKKNGKWNLAVVEQKTPETNNKTINVYIIFLCIQVLFNISTAEESRTELMLGAAQLAWSSLTLPEFSEQLLYQILRDKKSLHLPWPQSSFVNVVCRKSYFWIKYPFYSYEHTISNYNNPCHTCSPVTFYIKPLGFKEFNKNLINNLKGADLRGPTLLTNLTTKPTWLWIRTFLT